MRPVAVARSIPRACSERVTIYLVRHGETALNAAGVVQPADTPLSARGRAQADQLARRLAAARIGAIRSSDLPRAVETAQAVERATGAVVEIDSTLQERNFGEIRGTPYAALSEDIFGVDYQPPGGETWSAFGDRVERAWTAVLAAADRSPGALVVVTHGLVCRAVLELVLVPATGATLPARFGNTALTVLEGPPPWRARVVACTAHLDAATRAEGERV